MGHICASLAVPPAAAEPHPGRAAALAAQLEKELVQEADALAQQEERHRRGSITEELSLSAKSEETYLVTVMTGGRAGFGDSKNGTDANVYICLIG
jgi:hypothetical protein